MVDSNFCQENRWDKANNHEKKKWQKKKKKGEKQTTFSSKKQFGTKYCDMCNWFVTLNYN